ncbi:twin-arginine translocase TatA/TatE family subunit [Sphingomonas sp. LB-2]|uniref:twin-arginine translocase TatA/TatE family subunit n=1 Tax=Sphingomonas caeni TaxID=2984949 RepID=UPI002232637B|nr:twin-arginine translocase TatA/TatE family subunit [Sphingomonas caeni]MCW3847565.1 twin-arginine translocase TatA/TatE family subunit [Sphingomonas caeni]
MGAWGIGHWLVVGVLVILLFGGARFSNMMGDVAKGIKQFKKGMAEDDDAPPPSRIEGKAAPEPAVEHEAERTAEKR